MPILNGAFALVDARAMSCWKRRKTPTPSLCRGLSTDPGENLHRRNGWSLTPYVITHYIGGDDGHTAWRECGPRVIVAGLT